MGLCNAKRAGGRGGTFEAVYDKSYSAALKSRPAGSRQALQSIFGVSKYRKLGYKTKNPGRGPRAGKP